MVLQDLPVDLWLEILQYLSRSTLHKMLGISRALFELAFDDLYKEIRLVNNDQEMLKILKQLRYANGLHGLKEWI